MKIRRKCKCGCGGITNPGNKWIHGHHRRTKYPIRKIRRRCECGCGGITNYGKKYIYGHNGVENICSNLSEEHKKQVSLAQIGNTHRLGCKHTEKVKRKMSISHKDKKQPKKVRKKIGIATKKRWQDPEYQRKMGKAFDLKSNRSELKLGKVLNKLYPNEYKYVGDFRFFLGGKNPDFMNVNGQKKLIELYGDYWHKKGSERIRIDHFKQYGFNTLVIWEHELKESRLDLRRRLIDFHME
jgi:hypothetical protein